MYELYVKWCEEKKLAPQNKWLYYHIFNFEFNLGFHAPKKDLCNVCTEYNTKKDEQILNEDLNEKYNEHIKAKLEAREEKKQDIEACKNDPSTALLCFDMQSVLFQHVHKHRFQYLTIKKVRCL
ncbi:unnamed protein product [Psylliodes chrysocephalus]|uniref:Uncharacterized protein n=1 Tax=Psylliodes chrysocephalus TaxID=3402493 RepID=A0A9P0GID3_9CUCU|nr:unnamed protein product [Psylliodes chrysocephala]